MKRMLINATQKEELRVALVGPDGAGKSTWVRMLGQDMRGLPIGICYLGQKEYVTFPAIKLREWLGWLGRDRKSTRLAPDAKR